MDEYGIFSGYEERLEEDDKEGSRAIPSRTYFGNEASFVKEFPEYGRIKWGIRNFGYRCQLTLPQIELMISDLPHTLYKDKNKSSQADIDDATRKTLEAMEKKRKAEIESGKQFTIEEIFDNKE